MTGVSDLDAVVLRPLAAADLEPLRAIYNRQVAPGPGWTAAAVASMWTQSAHGDRTRVAVDGDRVAGGVGTVVAPPWLYIFPLVADGAAAADALLAQALGEVVAGVTTIRIGVRVGEEIKRAAVLARGFVRSIDFVELRHELAPTPPGRPSDAALRRLGHGELDREATRALHNLTFAEIANTAPLDVRDFAALLDDATAWPGATAAWAGADGAVAGFVIGQRDHDDRGDFGVVEAIGVAPAWRGRGVARTMIDDLLGRARAAGLVEVRSVVAGTNPGSLALHRAAGFTVAGQKQMYDLSAV